MKTLLLLSVTLILVAAAVILLAVKVLFVKGGEFPSGHVHDLARRQRVAKQRKRGEEL